MDAYMESLSRVADANGAVSTRVIYRRTYLQYNS